MFDFNSFGMNRYFGFDFFFDLQHKMFYVTIHSHPGNKAAREILRHENDTMLRSQVYGTSSDESVALKKRR